MQYPQRLILVELENSTVEHLKFYSNFTYFCEKVLNLEMTEYHKGIADLPLKHRYLCIVIPTGHSKTTLFTMAYALWRLWREKNIEICLVSSSIDQSMRMFALVQAELQTNPFFKELLPTDRFDTWNKSQLKTKNGNQYYIKPFNSTARGIHPQYIIYDDLLRESDIDMDTIKEMFWSVFYPRGQIHNCQHVVVGCVHPDTLVYTDKGLEKIGSLVPSLLLNDEKKLLTFNKKVLGKDGWDKTSKYYVNGKTKTKKIILVGGYELECSMMHPLWVCKENNRKWVTKKDISWIRSEDLKIGDRVALKLGARVFGKKETISEDIAYLYGLYISEGSLDFYGRSNRIAITNKAPEVISFLKNIFGFHNTDGIHNRKNSKELIQNMRRYGLPFERCYNKWIPDRIFKEPKKIQAMFLRGVYDGDGHSTYYKNGLRVCLTSTSKKQLLGVQQMLLNFGIVSHINGAFHKGHFKKDGTYIKKSYSYCLAFGGINSNIFMEEIGFGIKYKQKKVPEKGIRQVRQPFGFVWKKIKKIEDSESITVDFVIPKGHSFVSNGFISHNTPQGLDDLYAELEKKDEWHVVRKAAVTIENGEWRDPLWPERFPIEVLKKIRDSMAPYRFNREYLCKPSPTGTPLVSKEQLLNCLDENLEFSFEIKGIGYLGCDFAMSTEASGDFNVFTVVDDMSGKTYSKKTDKGIIEIGDPVIVRKITRFKGPGQIESIKQLEGYYKPAKIIADNSGVGARFVQELREAQINVYGQDFQPANRNQLLLNLGSLIEKGRLIIPSGPESEFLANALIREISGFGLKRTKANTETFRSSTDHDDMCISLALAVKDVIGPRISLSNVFYGA